MQDKKEAQFGKASDVMGMFQVAYSRKGTPKRIKETTIINNMETFAMLLQGMSNVHFAVVTQQHIIQTTNFNHSPSLETYTVMVTNDQWFYCIV